MVLGCLFVRIHLITELAKALEFVEQRAAADAEGFGGFGAIEVVLAERLENATGWVSARSGPEAQHIGYFGASTGAAAALVAAARLPKIVEAIVSRGGRPDLAGPSLEFVTAPTLLIVGEYDETVIELNQQAAAKLRGPHELVIVPRASHLFEEPGALEQVAYLARLWFEDYLLGKKANVA